MIVIMKLNVILFLVVFLISSTLLSVSTTDSEKEKSFFQKHKKIYFVTGFGSEKYPAWFAKSDKHNQVKFQISFRYYLISNIYFGFTEKAVWDLQDIDRSSPFQDANYNPEIFYQYKNKDGIFGLKSFDLLKLGIEHESNGKSKESGFSRSWNRVYIQTVFDFSSWFKLDLKSWIIIDKLIQSMNIVDKELFENNDIGQYYGNFDLKLIFSLHENLNLELLLRKGNNLDFKKGSLQLGIDFRIPIGFLVKNNINPRLYIQVFNGYGETLISYDKYQLKYRAGIMLFY